MTLSEAICEGSLIDELFHPLAHVATLILMRVSGLHQALKALTRYGLRLLPET